MTIDAQEFGRIIVSRPGENAYGHFTTAISTDVDRYVQLTLEEWEWLVYQAGPKVIEAMQPEIKTVYTISAGVITADELAHALGRPILGGIMYPAGHAIEQPFADRLNIPYTEEKPDDPGSVF